jgi:ASC-1-like (ASCH) protein
MSFGNCTGRPYVLICATLRYASLDVILSFNSENPFSKLEWPQFIGDSFWESFLYNDINASKFTGLVHIAILSKEYLEKILQGKKSVEARFSIHRKAPYGIVNRGDVIMLKLTGGPILGISMVDEAFSYQLDAKTLRDIRLQYAEELQIDDEEFWKQRKNAKYATLIKLSHVRAMRPISYIKRDRRAWVVLSLQRPLLAANAS